MQPNLPPCANPFLRICQPLRPQRRVYQTFHGLTNCYRGRQFRLRNLSRSSENYNKSRCCRRCVLDTYLPLKARKRCPFWATLTTHRQGGFQPALCGIFWCPAKPDLVPQRHSGQSLYRFPGVQRVYFRNPWRPSEPRIQQSSCSRRFTTHHVSIWLVPQS